MLTKREARVLRELWSLRDEAAKHGNKWTARGKKRADEILRWCKREEVALQTAARRSRARGGGWNIRHRGTRFQIVRWSRLRDKRGRPSNWPTAHKAGPHAAVRWALAQAGTHEVPYGSNGGPGISGWERAFGFGRVPWCGIFVGTALRRVGVKVTSRVASVGLIEGDAKAGANGFESWHGRTAGREGDAVVLFGYGVHVELIVRRRAWGYETCGGNTSPEGGSGSQSNGGGVYRRRRTFGQVRGVARPRY